MRITRGAFALAGAVLLFAAASPPPALAALDMGSGARGVAAALDVSDCNIRAKAALTSILQAPFEAGAGTGQWIAYAPEVNGVASAAAAIHCFPVNKGYVVTLSCAVERPADPETATELCARLQKAYDPTPNGGITWQ